MKSSKILPIAAGVVGLAAIGYILLGNKANTTPNPTTYVQPTTSNNNGSFWSNFGANISALFATGSTIFNTVSNVLKSSGSITSNQRVLVNGQYLTGLISPTAVKRLSAGNQIKIVPGAGSTAGFAGTFAVVQMGNEWGGMSDTLIVIQKPYEIAVVTGTFQEI